MVLRPRGQQFAEPPCRIKHHISQDGSPDPSGAFPFCACRYLAIKPWQPEALARSGRDRTPKRTCHGSGLANAAGYDCFVCGSIMVANHRGNHLVPSSCVQNGSAPDPSLRAHQRFASRRRT